MTLPRPSVAAVRRKQLQDKAYDIGVTGEFLDAVVDDFYARVRKHPLLGRIFEDQIGDDWGPHIETMKRFWRSVALNHGSYTGKPVIVHTGIPDISPGQFSIWLGLFEQSLAALSPTAEAKAHVMVRAERIARTLKSAVETRDGVAT